MIRSLKAALALLAMLASATAAQDRGLPTGERVDAVPARGRIAINANPSAIIAAEIALGQLAREKGEAKAMRETSVEGALIADTEPVAVEAWLKAQSGVTAPTKWDGQTVWMSCDGSIGVIEGIWSREVESGRFTSVWQRQKKGGYQWLLRHRDQASAISPDPLAFLSATVADCPARPERKPPPEESRPKKRKAKDEPPPVDPLNGSSADKSLAWRSETDKSGVQRLLVQISKDGAMKTVLGTELEPEPQD